MSGRSRLFAGLVLCVACSPPAGAVSPAPADRFDRIPRADFNRRAAEEALPLFWRADADEDGALDPDEMVELWGWEGPSLDTLIDGHDFTPAFAALYDRLRRPVSLHGLSADERARRTAVLAELAQGRPTLLETDLRGASAEDRAIVGHILRAAVLIERVYARQKGVFGLDARIPADDPASRMLFFRNQGPTCDAPKTEGDPACTAVPGVRKPPSGLYPAALQEDPRFCERLAAQPNAAELTAHFTVVVDGPAPGSYQAVPYHLAYREDMEAIARELEGAAAAIQSPGEEPFAAYLRAAAGAFRDNDWEKADAAWAAMGGKGSKWYLRIAPDEVYHEPCALKAGFHVSFAFINPGSVAWREKLEPVKTELEAALASLAGPPYAAREVAFHLPDFVDIILNAGDSRSADGANIGQSLPNWGVVAEAGGRTVAMSNLYTDADSKTKMLAQSSSLFCPATQALVSTEADLDLMSTVLHEAAHNLGPTRVHRVDGKTDDEVFGGPLASIMEELKSEAAALYFSEWLAARGVITADFARRAHVRSVIWAFGAMSQGLYSSTGAADAHAQLAAMLLGTLHREGVLAWKAGALAANGTDRGCFEIDLARWPAVVDVLTARVLRAKARGDRADADAMKAAFVDSKDSWADLRAIIEERWRRAPRATFVYSLRWQ